MKVKQLIGERLKERPSDCQTESHALMIRGGYMKQVANGIYSQYPPLRRICQKIEKSIREEMDAIGGQEIQFPVVLPASLWEESGRYRSVGEELLRFSDRFGSPLVLGMTHEEAAVHLVREYGQSYARYPFMIYQIQTKFRDEARPRAGPIPSILLRKIWNSIISSVITPMNGFLPVLGCPRLSRLPLIPE